ncbi:SRPBCC family protein [Dermatobacter hominis]|uniref:SRPBCC family protein n=1 Tax=Dermatobacter hominis TaxID=2884263 RepID=UPI001D12C8BA|nr:SRPBCC family protein [Dermatobacter hominis]UDY34772.1 SRPBCC family protein [Dermatobacter hominis]
MEYERSMRIEAPADVVWRVMSDVERWHTWTASIESIEITGPGDAESGAPLGSGGTAIVRQPGFPKAEWTVTEWRPGRSFTWESPAPGVRSVGIHSVEPDGDAASTATLTIRQTGVLGPLIGLLFGRRSRRYVDLEADGLTARAEELARTASR